MLDISGSLNDFVNAFMSFLSDFLNSIFGWLASFFSGINFTF